MIGVWYSTPLPKWRLGDPKKGRLELPIRRKLMEARSLKELVYRRPFHIVQMAFKIQILARSYSEWRLNS
jgi:hypothetical protein